MTSNRRTGTVADPVVGGGPVSVGDAAGPSVGDLARLVACVRQADRLLAEAAGLAGRLAGSGVCEQHEGLPLEQFVGLAARMTGSDARMLVTAGQVLEDLPAVAALFASGVLGWGQVRAIVSATRPLSQALRRRVDERVRATAAQHRPGLEAFDPDGLVWAVDEAVAQLRPTQTRQAERRAAQGSFLARQMNFEGGMRLYGELDVLSAAVVNNALDARMSGRPPAGAGQPGCDPAYDPHTGDEHSTGDDHTVAGTADGADGGDLGGGLGAGGWSPSLTGRAAANALVELCAESLGGVAGDGTPKPAKPLLVAHVDLSQVTAHPSGTVELDLRGPLPRIGAATLERLACDADLRAVLFDRHRPLAASTTLRLKDLSAKTRLAVQARDQGCRWPGSPDPIGFCDIDHLRPRAHGGDHHPDLLAAISRRFHTIRHRHRWSLTLQPDTGMLTIERAGRRYHSLPNGTRLAPPADQRPANKRPAKQRPPNQPPDQPPGTSSARARPRGRPTARSDPDADLPA